MDQNNDNNNKVIRIYYHPPNNSWSINLSYCIFESYVLFNHSFCPKTDYNLNFK